MVKFTHGNFIIIPDSKSMKSKVQVHCLLDFEKAGLSVAVSGKAPARLELRPHEEGNGHGGRINGYVMHNWNSNRRDMDEGETRGASRSKRKYRKATPKKVNNNATMPLYDPKAIAEIAFLRRFTSIPKPCWSFRAGAQLNRSFSFLFLLLSRASPPFVSYDMDHLRL